MVSYTLGQASRASFQVFVRSGLMLDRGAMFTGIAVYYRTFGVSYAFPYGLTRLRGPMAPEWWALRVRSDPMTGTSAGTSPLMTTPTTSEPAMALRRKILVSQYLPWCCDEGRNTETSPGRRACRDAEALRHSIQPSELNDFQTMV